MPATDAGRPLTVGERALAASVFGRPLDPEPVRIVARTWWPLQPRGTAMAPDGSIWFHPRSEWLSQDFSREPLGTQALFVHELVHVWQVQRWGRWHLILLRHPLCRYRYRLVPGRPFRRYGLEQQAEMARHLFLWRHGLAAAGAAPREALEEVVRFG
ncbi:MAG: vgr related protein [Alphaproteobacteria bacterium]|nr:vgr related protein [Alphaproteobacteria bacterium]